MQTVTLYYGSRHGITGNIQPAGRPECDFGKGFYMYKKSEHAKALVYNQPDAAIYSVKLHLENIPENRILRLSGMEWVYYVLYNHKRLEDVKNTKFYRRYAAMDENTDVIIGPAAADYLSITLQQFADGMFPDRVIYETLRTISIIWQYTAKTRAACSQVEITAEKPVVRPYCKKFQDLSMKRCEYEERLTKNIRCKYRRTGMYLDEILDNIE